ncbi:hypothetical protein STAQ_30280 [Allostella sp. ATCC 35155]|nr:hypothetical protein STAQ_30280 [Stella sp. ATCC 35155]
MPNSSIERLAPERTIADRPPSAATAAHVLSIAAAARDQTLVRGNDHRPFVGLFWLLVIAPALAAGLAGGPLAALVALPLQLLAALVAGSIVARFRQCGALTLAFLPLSAAALVWASLHWASTQ